MNALVRAALDAGLAELARVVDAPVAPYGYGTDISCSFDLDPGVEVGGLTLLAQAVRRRLDCPRKGLVDDANYGLDLRGELNKGTTAKDIASLAGRIRNEVTKDDRIASVKVKVTPSPDGSSLRIALAITPFDSSVGPFSMVLAVTSAAVLLEAIGR